MVDLHHHLLFGVDDGSKTLEQSVAMVTMAAEDGITHIVATPHADDRWRYDRERNVSVLQQIREALPADVANRMTLGLGCDFHMNLENTEDARTNGRNYTINETEYLLIELPDVGISPRLNEMLYQMRLDGLTPILTHPERNMTLQRNREKLKEWVADGLLLQVTAGSVSGQFGPVAESVAWELLENQWVTFLATDAHDLQRRPPRMSAAHYQVEQRLGEATAERLCVTNPLAVFEGRPLPQQPAPRGIFPEFGSDDEDDARPWWKRMLGRF